MGVRNLGNTLALRGIFFWKCSKLKLDFKTAENNSENLFCLWDNFIWIGRIKFSLLRREYLSSAVNMLRKRLKILHITKSDFKSDSILFRVIRQYGKGFAVHISTVFERVLSCCLSKGAVKRHFLDIFLTMFLGFQNFVNTLAMRVVVFLKMFKT